ncbi:3-oxoacyl-ACP reductase FabG [Oxalobacteraceae bacterium]|nr:3-oxoacyl-ACP reductase FabG [Oxalobacteraceae bacterium]
MARIAVVTGASRGIGRAIALKLAEQGWDIAFCYQRDEAAAADTAAAIRACGVRADMARCDVAELDQVERWMAGLEQRLGAPFALVNSAGITRDAPLAMMAAADWQAVIDTNLGGVFNVCRSAAMGMIKRGEGSIVNLSSVWGVHGNATQVNYSASKAGMIGFSKALAKEVGRYNIRVNAIAPGLIDTDMTEGLSSAVKNRMLASIALRRAGSAREVANLAAFLLSDDAAYITGQVLGIDGGMGA